MGTHVAASAAAGAVLTHYLAVFPVAALAILALDARPAARHALVLSGLGAAASVRPRAVLRRGLSLSASARSKARRARSDASAYARPSAAYATASGKTE